jgi:hypothetical protein
MNPQYILYTLYLQGEIQTLECLYLLSYFCFTDYVKFWINTIVTYCKGSGEGYPKIMVILTHKDKIEEVSSHFHDIHKIK